MEVSEKIKRYSSFEDLIAAIKEDITTRDFLSRRYGVRFIMLNSFDTLRKLVVELQNLEQGVDMVTLDGLIPSDEPDSWITTDALKERVFSCKKPSLITPFSELVRFYPEDQFRGFFSEIILSEKSKGSRIYIPIIGLENRFTDFLSHFGRLSESAPIWQYTDPVPQSVEVYVVQKYKDLNPTVVGKRCHLRTLSDWLQFWKNAPKEKIICSSLPININRKYSRPDNIFKFTPITNAYDYITQFMDVSLDFTHNSEEDVYLDELLSDIVSIAKENFNLWDYIRERFNMARLTANAALNVWGQGNRTAYDRWLIKKYLEHLPELKSHEYLQVCLSETSDLEKPYELFVKLATYIFYVPGEATKFHDEREQLMQRFPDLFVKNVPISQQKWIQERISETGQTSTDTAVYFCTGTFDFEKEYLMGVYANHGKEPCGKTALRLYPDLKAYLSDAIPTQFVKTPDWTQDYFKAYKDAKIQDSITGKIEGAIKEHNSSKDAFYGWYFKFTNTKERLATIKKNKTLNPDRIYWLDGLGAEYLPLIKTIFECESEFQVVYSEFTRANLPSETVLNGFYEKEVTKKDGIDKLGHDGGMYKPYGTLVKEIDMVREYVMEMIKDNQGAPTTIAIVSDHGMSSLSRKAESRKLDGKYDHEGRFMEVPKDKFADDDFFFTHQNEDDGKYYRIALTHSSLAKKPTHEVHGGATPEEVIVPFIIVTNKSSSKKQEFHIIPVNEKVAISDALVEVTIIPQPTAAFLRFNGKDYEMTRKSTQWSVKVEGVVEGINNFVIIPEAGEPQNISIEFFGFAAGSIDDEFDI